MMRGRETCALSRLCATITTAAAPGYLLHVLRANHACRPRTYAKQCIQSHSTRSELVWQAEVQPFAGRTDPCQSLFQFPISSAMRMHLPTDQQLVAALARIKRGRPEIGVKKMLVELKKRYPEWQVSSRRVRDLHAQADPDTAPDGDSEEEEAADARASSSAGSSKRDDGLRSFFEGEIAYFDAIARSGRRVPISQYHTKNNPTVSLGMLSAIGDSQFTCGLEVFRSYLQGGEPDEDVSEDLYMLYAPYRLFRAEWRAYLGPKDATLPRAIPYKENVEALEFFMLFPFGIGHYKNQPNLAFEEYALRHLRNAKPMFRDNKEWLLWVLTRTENEELTIAVNCVLAVKHGIKGRHLGQGRVEFRSVEAPFIEQLVPDA